MGTTSVAIRWRTPAETSLGLTSRSAMPLRVQCLALMCNECATFSADKARIAHRALISIKHRHSIEPKVLLKLCPELHGSILSLLPRTTNRCEIYQGRIYLSTTRSGSTYGTDTEIRSQNVSGRDGQWAPFELSLV